MAGDEDRSFLLSYLEGRFGIPKDGFRHYLLFKKNRSYWMLKESSHVTRASGLKVKIMGMKVFQEVGKFIKPTTRFIQMFGHTATRAILEINKQDLRDLVAGNFLPVDMGIDNGYVILSIENRILGLGLLIDGCIRTQIPRKEIMYSMRDELEKLT
ncbi:hypothetical protein ACFL1Z_03705 [Thermodesulfobacteriota bacterium]